MRSLFKEGLLKHSIWTDAELGEQVSQEEMDIKDKLAKNNIDWLV